MQQKAWQFMAGIAASALLCACAPEHAQQTAPAAETQQALRPLAPQQTEAWAGTYRGELPCPNCDYIEAELTLNPDSSYAFKSRHVGRVAGEMAVAKQGVFRWRGDGLVELDAAGDNMVFFVGEGALEMRGNDGKAYPDRHGKICRLQQTAAFDARK